jgi:hypothetical protein
MSKITIDKKFFDPSSLLLEKFRDRAPGSYKHCQNVENMCGSIASELDLNVDLLRCGALYHDVGKMNNPMYYSENQTSDANIHDKLDPLTSCSYITRHVGDGIIHLLQLKDMPHEVIELVSQHHGDNIVGAFYKKGEPEDLYRYKCPKPESTEAIILMIVDSVEAAAKSKINNKEDDEDEADIIIEVVNMITEKLTKDGQLNNMTIGNFEITKKLLVKELGSVYHKRVVYENGEKEKTIAETIEIDSE